VTPYAQRRTERRATPATLTGVRGRPTLASAVETKLGTKEEIESRSARWSPPSPTIPATMTIPIFFDTFIEQLLF
jgi:hypothetical protein